MASATGTARRPHPPRRSGGAVAAYNTSGTNTISAPIVLTRTGSALQTISQAAGGTLILSGPISSGGLNADVQFVGNGKIELGCRQHLCGNHPDRTHGWHRDDDRADRP